MNESVQWPDGEFTIREAIARNSNLPEKSVRESLSAAISAKKIAQVRKGNHKIQGKFQVVKSQA